MGETIAEALSAYFTGLSYEDIPESVIDGSQNLLLDYTGVSLRGSRTESGAIASEFAIKMSGYPLASVVGRREKTEMVHASFANAVCAHSIELDDVDDRALIHFGPPVISAALAAGEVSGATGRELLVAIVCGCEMMARVNNAVNPSLRNRGFHSTPTCGVFGAAVAAGRLLGLDAQQMTWAIGLAGAQASGLMEMYGDSMQKRFNPGPAARNGLTAALLAKRGFTGAKTIFEGERGFGRAFCDVFFPEKLIEDLGKTIPFQIEFKPYACARPIHSAIDCALEIREQPGFNLENINAIKVWRHPTWVHYHLNKRPASFHEAQVSLPYSFAVALIDGAALLTQYSEERLQDSAVQRLSDIVEVKPDPSLPHDVACRVEVLLRNGLRFMAQVNHPKGSNQNPMTSADLERKLHSLVDEIIGNFNAEEIVRLVNDIASLNSLADLLDLMCLRKPTERLG